MYPFLPTKFQQSLKKWGKAINLRENKANLQKPVITRTWNCLHQAELTATRQAFPLSHSPQVIYF